MGPCILRITDEFLLINVLDCVGTLNNVMYDMDDQFVVKIVHALFLHFT